MSADFTATRMGRGFAGGLPCQAPGRRGAPERAPRGPADAGDRARILLGRIQPAAASHLSVEDTAPPFAVRPRA